MRHIQTTSMTKVTTFDGYNFSLTIIRPFFTLQGKCAISVFLFVPNKPCDFSFISSQEQIASEMVTSSGQAAAILNRTGQTPLGIPVFELFAAMKWIARHGNEVGIDGSKWLLWDCSLEPILQQFSLWWRWMTIVGCQSPDIDRSTILHFSKKNVDRPMTCRSQPNLLEQEWLNMKSIYNLPLDSMVSELNGLPPYPGYSSQKIAETLWTWTLLQQAPSCRNTGTHVIYINYDARDDEPHEGSIFPLCRTLLAHTAAEVSKILTYAKEYKPQHMMISIEGLTKGSIADAENEYVKAR